MKRRRIELVPIVVFKNRRFSICRDLVATERRVSRVIVVAIMIVTTQFYVYIYRDVYAYFCVSLYIYI